MDGPTTNSRVANSSTMHQSKVGGYPDTHHQQQMFMFRVPTSVGMPVDDSYSMRAQQDTTSMSQHPSLLTGEANPSASDGHSTPPNFSFPSTRYNPSEGHAQLQATMVNSSSGVMLRAAVVNADDYENAASFFVHCKEGNVQEAINFLHHTILSLRAIDGSLGAMNGDPMYHMADGVPASSMQAALAKQGGFVEKFSDIQQGNSKFFAGDSNGSSMSSNPYGSAGGNKRMALDKAEGGSNGREFEFHPMNPHHQSMASGVAGDDMTGMSPTAMHDRMPPGGGRSIQGVSGAPKMSTGILGHLPPPPSTVQEIPMVGDDVDNRPSTLIMLVPGKPHIIGHLIGKGGIEIGKIEAETGVTVKIESQGKMPLGSMERRVSIIGTIKSNVIAQQYVSIKVQEKLLQEGIQQEILRLVVPNETVRHLIGKSGANINKLQNESGARIQVEPESSMVPGSFGRTIVLQGTQACRTHAQYLIARQMSEDRNLHPDWAGINKPTPSAANPSQDAGAAAGDSSNSGIQQQQQQFLPSSTAIHQSQRQTHFQNAFGGGGRGSSQGMNAGRNSRPYNASNRGGRATFGSSLQAKNESPSISASGHDAWNSSPRNSNGTNSAPAFGNGPAPQSASAPASSKNVPPPKKYPIPSKTAQEQQQQ